jgi:integrase
MRLGRLDWRLIPIDGVRASYATVRDTLVSEGQSPRWAATALNLLGYFAVAYNEGISGLRHSADLSAFNRFSEGLARARRTWRRLAVQHGWCGPHLRAVHAKLGAALRAVDPEFAAAVVPGGLRRTEADIVFESRRSVRTQFRLHDCMPRRVRSLGTTGARYRILCDVATAMADVLQSVSAGNLRPLLLFFDTVLFGGDGFLPRDAGADTYLVDLRRNTPLQWLQRYDGAFPQQRRITFELFKKEVRWLHLFHAMVVHAAEPSPPARIPIPRETGRMRAAEDAGAAVEGVPVGNVTSDASSAGSSSAGRQRRDQVRALRNAVASLRGRFTRPRAVETDLPKAFSVQQTRAVVEAAAGPLEQLAIGLLFSTGLRITGLANLRLPGGSTPDVGNADDVPGVLETVEKGNKPRRVALNPANRALAARWLRSPRRLGRATALLFPGRDAACPISRSYLYKRVRGVIARAGVAGHLAHPHTCRHTTVKILWMIGNQTSFSAVS